MSNGAFSTQNSKDLSIETFHVPIRRKTLMMRRMRLSAARMVLMIMNSELPRAIRVPEPPRPSNPMSWFKKIFWELLVYIMLYALKKIGCHETSH